MAIRKRLARRAQRDIAQPPPSTTITDPHANRAAPAPVGPGDVSPAAAAARANFRNPDAHRAAS
jgi:hypothetical protein